MGATQSKSDNDTINWNNIKTDDMSSMMPNFNGLSKEAKQLIASLDIPEITESEVSELNYNNILGKINSNLSDDDKIKFQKILDQVSESESLSATSPFISNEMYDNLVNSKTSDEEVQQKGGSRHMKKKGGAWNDDDSDTSSTSLDSEDEDVKDDDEDILDSNEEKIKKEKAKKDKKKKRNDSEMSGGELSYLSSSAHTGGEFSEEPSEQENDVETISETEESVADEKKDMEATSISVNTEDINMISDY